MSRFSNTLLIAAIAVVMLLPSAALAAIVAQIQDSPKDGVVSAAGVFRSLGSNGWIEDDTRVASDGNEVLTVSIDPSNPGYNSGNNGAGYVWYLETKDFATALGLPDTTPIQNGWVIRQSAWIAEAADDPLLNEGDWTDSFKLEYTRSTNPSGGGFSSGTIIPNNFLHNDCDFGTETCSTPPQAPTPYPAGETGHINSDNWTQIVMQQEIDDFDFPWALDGILFVRPVLFVGDFTGGEDEKGTLFMDRIIVEVFPDLATANATPLDTTNPGGIPGLITSVVGDFDGDGDVDGDDFGVFVGEFGNNNGGPPFDIADFDEDGDVDGDDFGVFVGQFGTGTSTTIPEPTSVVLLLTSLLGATTNRRS